MANPEHQKTFSQIALDLCYNNFKKGLFKPYFVKNVLKYKMVSLIDVSPIKEFLDDNNLMIQNGSIQIIGEKGDVNDLLPISRYTNMENKLLAIKYILKNKDATEEINEVFNTTSEYELVNIIKIYGKSEFRDKLLFLMYHEKDSIRTIASKYLF